MDAIVPAAGEGTRLRPVTEEKPKGLVEVDGEPILTHAFRDLLAVGADKLVVVVGYRCGQIVEHYGESFAGVPVEYVVQHERKGIGHALDAAADHVDDAFVMYLGDNVFDSPPRRAVEAFRGNDAEVVFPVEEVPPEAADKYAVCDVRDGDTRGQPAEVVDVREKPDDPPSNLVMTGFMVASPVFFDVCAALEPSDRGEYELGDAVRNTIDRGHTVRALPLVGERRNVNTQADVEVAESLLADGT